MCVLGYVCAYIAMGVHVYTCVLVYVCVIMQACLRTSMHVLLCVLVRYMCVLAGTPAYVCAPCECVYMYV